MSKILVSLLVMFLSYFLAVAPVQALGCDWVSQLRTNSGIDIDVANKGYLDTQILREESERLLKNISSYNACIDKEIKHILSEMDSSATEATNRAQLVSTFEKKLGEFKKSNQIITQQLLQQEQQLEIIREESASTNEAFGKLIERLELALVSQMNSLEGVDGELELGLKSTANQIDGLTTKLGDIDDRMGSGLSDLGKTLSTKVSSLEGVDGELELGLKSTANQIDGLTTKLGDIDDRMGSGLSDLNKILSDKSLYGIISILTVSLIIILLFLVLRKSIFDQRNDLGNDLKVMKKEIKEESIGLDNKLVNLIESQLSIKSEKGSISGETDHSLALKVADEIVRIQKNTLQMDPKTKGLKQLVASVKRIQNNFSSNGYDIIEMLDQPYDEGMNASANFILDEELNENEQVITKIIKPQVNYQSVMIQAAQIEVSKGE